MRVEHEFETLRLASLITPALSNINDKMLVAINMLPKSKRDKILASLRSKKVEV